MGLGADVEEAGAGGEEHTQLEGRRRVKGKMSCKQEKQEIVL